MIKGEPRKVTTLFSQKVQLMGRTYRLLPLKCIDTVKHSRLYLDFVKAPFLHFENKIQLTKYIFFDIQLFIYIYHTKNYQNFWGGLLLNKIFLNRSRLVWSLCTFSSHNFIWWTGSFCSFISQPLLDLKGKVTELILLTYYRIVSVLGRPGLGTLNWFSIYIWHFFNITFKLNKRIKK